MIAKVVMVQAIADLLRVRFDCFFEPGEQGYEEYYVEVLDAEGNPTGEWQETPFDCHFEKVNPDTKPAAIEALMRDYLQKYQQSLEKLKQARANFIGLEVREQGIPA